ncbi:hypothetical protein HF325_002175 [Metschnikowia pulcherrima]|uniref:Uncharacterized protein n=1 Tax=Metschnikowia pulcherrima TaxID=27326 RepID=A0A8H7GSI1_9ASCO|nr:hypothetical protein HF325_002175 [Metschnikowia pulcherrima]
MSNHTKKRAKHRNILPNTYIPVHTPKVLHAVLSRLAKSSAVALVSLWPTLKNTQPTIISLQNLSKTPILSQAQVSKKVRETAKEMQLRKWTKARVIDAILYEFWPRGLNLLQLAQVDCQLIVDNPNSYTWVLLTVKDVWDNEVAVALDPAVFLDRLAAQLSTLFWSYIYVCTHPTFPLVLVRIQVFDLAPNSTKQASIKQAHITSHKPYFLAVPMNLPHVIHSPGEDLVSQTVLQVVESCLSKGPSQVLRLHTNRAQKPVRLLESMHILKGCSRFAHSLGPWAPYADGEADVSPFARHELHPAVKSAAKTPESSQSKHESLLELANLRFKGSIRGETVSDRLFDHPNPSKRRRTRSERENLDLRPKTPYASLAPISVAEFELQEPFRGEKTATSSVKLTFSGTDVFAGMHELAVRPTETPFIDLETLPGWLTGEEGQSCGIVKNGVFLSKI